MREASRSASRNVSQQLADNSLRKTIRLNLVLDGQPTDLREQAPVPADDPSQQALMAEVIQSACLAVSLTGGVDESQPARISVA